MISKYAYYIYMQINMQKIRKINITKFSESPFCQITVFFNINYQFETFWTNYLGWQILNIICALNLKPRYNPGSDFAGSTVQDYRPGKLQIKIWPELISNFRKIRFLNYMDNSFHNQDYQSVPERDLDTEQW